MAQVEVYQDVFVLSPILSLRVAANTQIEFIVTAVKKQMRISKVTINRAAWRSLHDFAIKRANELMESNIEDTWMYHPKTKMITVSKKYMGWEILPETYTSRGHPRREHNIYFSELEWAELMKNLIAINARICEIELRRKQNTNKKTHMSIQWKFTTEGEGHTPKCHYRKCDARKAASFQVRDCHDIEQELAARGLEFKHVLKVNVHPADFMRDHYYSLIGHTPHSVQNLVRKGCAADLLLNKTVHFTEHGCIIKGRNILKDYWDVAMDVIQDILVVQVFYNCWKKLNLHFTDRMAHLIDLKTMLKDMYRLTQEVTKMMEYIDEHPVSLIVSEAFGEIQISDKIKEVLKVHYPQDKTPRDGVQCDCDCMDIEAGASCYLEEDPMGTTVSGEKRQSMDDQGDVMKKRLKLRL